jgi:hypothetical protein
VIDVERNVEILARPNPTMGKPRAGDWNVWVSKRDATAALMASGLTRETIDAMVSALCESRIDVWRREREAHR